MMQFREPGILRHTESVGEITSNQLASPPVSLAPSDYLSPIREEALQLLRTDSDRAHVIWFAAGALVVGFGLGWASNSSWYGSPTVVASTPVIQKDASYRRPETKSANRIESARRPAAPGTGINNSPKPQGLSTGAVPRPDGEAQRTAAAALPPDFSLPTGSIAPREPAPETRPTTIEGWSVRDVRGGTVVLEGPDGTWTAVAGDTVPGVGRIDSIVRWGNRWIVATAGGLIATP
jgi:hypothetical protein